MRYSPLTRRFTVWLLAAAVIPMVAIGLALFGTFDAALERVATEKLSDIADKKADQIEAYLQERLVRAQIQARSPTIQGAVVELARGFAEAGPQGARYREADRRYRPYFGSITDTAGYYDFFLIDPHGRVVYSQKREADFGTDLFNSPYRDTPLAQVTHQALATLDTALSDFAFYPPSSDFAAFIAAPLILEGRVVGVLAYQIDNEHVYRVVGDAVGLGETGETLVARRLGTTEALVTAPLKYDTDAAFERRLDLSRPEHVAIRLGLAGGRGSRVTTDYRGEPVLAVWRYLPRLEWGMVVKQDTREAFASARRMKLIGAAILVAAAVAALIAAVVLGRRIGQPLRQLTEGAQALAQGRLDQPVPVTGQDEIGQLASAFNIMAVRLLDNQAELEQRVQDRTAALHQEVMERERAEREAVAAHGQLQGVLDAATQVAIITADLDGLITLFNPGAERMLGYTAAEMVGRETPMRFHDAAEVEARGRALSEEFGRPVQGFDCFVEYARLGRHDEREWTYVRRDGSTFTVNLVVTGIRDATGRLTGFLGVATDITERLRVDRLKREFLSTVSHELRTPLTSISGTLNLLAGGVAGPLPEQARPLIEAAQRNSQHLTQLINDLLDMDKIAAGRMQFVLEEQALRPLVEQAIEMNRGYAERYGVRYVLEPGTEDGVVRADAQRLIQVLANFLSNAAKFSPRGGQVEIGVGRSEGRLRVWVRDHGPGIPDHFRDRIFQRFSQADASDTRVKGGTGLGLAISKAMVEGMGGRIGFDSQEGHGATFFFELPAVAA